MHSMFLPFAAHLLIVVCVVSARDVVFPPVLSLERLQQPFGQDDGIDISTRSDFHGLTTIANLPYANCFTDKDIDAYDIAILGSPFDTVSTAPITNMKWAPAKSSHFC